MTTTPVQPVHDIPPHCTITSCWSADVHELHDKNGRVIAHYCPKHRQDVIALRQNETKELCKVTAREVTL